MKSVLFVAANKARIHPTIRNGPKAMCWRGERRPVASKPRAISPPATNAVARKKGMVSIPHHPHCRPSAAPNFTSPNPSGWPGSSWSSHSTPTAHAAATTACWCRVESEPRMTPDARYEAASRPSVPESGSRWSRWSTQANQKSTGSDAICAESSNPTLAP